MIVYLALGFFVMKVPSFCMILISEAKTLPKRILTFSEAENLAFNATVISARRMWSLWKGSSSQIFLVIRIFFTWALGSLLILDTFSEKL